jgi:hypothetical protein
MLDDCLTRLTSTPIPIKITIPEIPPYTPPEAPNLGEEAAYFTLPLKTPFPVQILPAQSQSLNILITDDNAIN